MKDLKALQASLIESDTALKHLAQERKKLDAANLLYDGYATLWRSDALMEHALLLDPGNEVTDYMVSFFGKEPRTFQCITAFHAASEAERLINAQVSRVYVDQLPFLWRSTPHEGLYYTPIDGFPSDD